jgi:hypothetical protein
VLARAHRNWLVKLGKNAEENKDLRAEIKMIRPGKRPLAASRNQAHAESRIISSKSPR